MEPVVRSRPKTPTDARNRHRHPHIWWQRSRPLGGMLGLERGGAGGEERGKEKDIVRPGSLPSIQGAAPSTHSFDRGDVMYLSCNMDGRVDCQIRHPCYDGTTNGFSFGPVMSCRAVLNDVAGMSELVSVFAYAFRVLRL